MLRYVFQNPALFTEALTNRAYRNRNREVAVDNQRLEFLGDAVLELVVSRRLFDRFPSAQEGALTVMRTRVTDEAALAAIARRLGLGPLLLLDEGQEKQGIRDNDSVLSDAVESLLGAIYLDGGLAAAEAAFDRTFAPELADLDGFEVDKPVRWKGNPKGALQEFAARRLHQEPVYELLSRQGPDHAPVFRVAVRIGENLRAEGEGPSKQKAEAAAAETLLAAIG